MAETTTAPAPAKPATGNATPTPVTLVPNNQALPKGSDKDPRAPKYTRDQTEKAEQKVVENAAKAREDRKKRVDKIVADLTEMLEGEDLSVRDDLLRDLTQRVGSISRVAASPHLRASRSQVQELDDEVMPMTAPGSTRGEVPNRNILSQQDEIAAAKNEKK